MLKVFCKSFGIAGHIYTEDLEHLQCKYIIFRLSAVVYLSISLLIQLCLSVKSLPYNKS